MTLLGLVDELLIDTPVGMAISRAVDATAAYASQDDSPLHPVSDELASASIALCEVILDLLVELGVTV